MAVKPAVVLILGVVALFTACGGSDGGGVFDEIVQAELDQVEEVAVAPPDPTVAPLLAPTAMTVPTTVATSAPTAAPTIAPTAVPTSAPTAAPTIAPTAVPTSAPTAAPTIAPTAPPTATQTPSVSTEATATPTPDVDSTPTVTPTRPPLTPDPQVSANAGLGSPSSGPDPTDANDIYPNPDYDGEVRAVRTDGGVVMAVRGGGFGAFDVVTPCHRVAKVYGAELLTDRVDVLLDPGHGGGETGAVGANGLTEADVNLRVSTRLKAELERRGFSVELTRYANHRVAIQSRAALANALAPRIFMSIHHNGGYPLPFDKPGHEIFFQRGDADAQRLGGLVFEEFDAAFGGIELAWVSNATRGVSWRSNKRGTDLYGVLRRTPGLVTVLTEAMFLTNPPEAELLAQPAILDLEAQALANAIERFFTSDDPGTGFIEGLVFQGDLGSGGGTDGCVDPVLIPAN